MEIKKIEKKLNELGPWNFLIELKPGVFTIPRVHWQGLWHNIVVQDYIARNLHDFLVNLKDADPSKTTIIDIGCNEGWLTHVLWKMGFNHITGIDGNQKNIEKALFIKDCLGMDNVDFVCSDIYDFSEDKEYDISVMLGVVNHLSDPVCVLKKIHGFTAKYLIMDFNSFCSDYKDDSLVLNKDKTTLSSIFGTMRCQFEMKGDLTNIHGQGDLVFQFSRRAMTILLNYVGFGGITELLPGIAVPPNYKNDKRVFLSARKKNHNNFNIDLLYDKKYETAEKDLFFTEPILIEEGFNGFNIIQQGKFFVGVPQGKFNEFNFFQVADDPNCIFGLTQQEVKDLIVSQNKQPSTCQQSMVNDQITLEIIRELIRQSRFALARKLLEKLKKKHLPFKSILLAEIFAELGHIALKESCFDEGSEYFQKCLDIDPEFPHSAIIMQGGITNHYPKAHDIL